MSEFKQPSPRMAMLDTRKRWRTLAANSDSANTQLLTHLSQTQVTEQTVLK
ncbi:MAG: hypothetical protein O2983_09315 [Planctomycetota bacterium]|nr:hypothetical protein [Planctomycetota bacterium]MDA0919980.1 hypothetical protein [Planctomycetota bacterium]MDA1159795.1 hypothetical protein [Planctomycetota bacterium]